MVASPVTPLQPAQLGGAQAALCDLAVGLAARGHDVEVFCSEGSEVPGIRTVTVPAPADADVALVMPLGPPPRRAPGVVAAIEEMFETLRRHGPDAVSQHAFDAAAFDAAHGLPVLHTLHLPPSIPDVVAAVARFSARQLATVSQSSAADWKRAGVDVANVIRNGVADLDLGDPAVERVALVAGRISPEKGVEHALAAARVAGLPVRIAGQVYDPSYAPDLGGAEVLGRLSRFDLRRTMAASAVTVCAVRWEEPFGLVAAEAQMAGCPVAAYRRGAMPEVIKEGVSGFLAAPDDVDALAAAIDACLGLDRESVRASARRRLGLEAMIDGYERTLAEIAS